MTDADSKVDATAPRRVVLHPEIGVAEAKELQGMFLLCLNEPTVHLDAGEVRKIGAAGVQMLVALALELQRRSTPLNITVASESFLAALQASGVERLLPPPVLVTFD
jgi:anti-anti-sigma regulatory factor